MKTTDDKIKAIKKTIGDRQEVLKRSDLYIQEIKPPPYGPPFVRDTSNSDFRGERSVLLTCALARAENGDL